MSFSFVYPKPSTASTSVTTTTSSGSRVQIPKRKDSTETIRPTDSKVFRSGSSALASNGKSNTKPTSERRYSPDALWKAVQADASSRVSTHKVTRSSTLPFPTSSPPRASDSGSKTKRKKTHRRSNAIHGVGRTSDGGVTERKLSANFAVEESRQKSSLGSKSGRHAVASVSKVNALGLLVEPHRKDIITGEADSKENNRDGRPDKRASSSSTKGNTREGKPESLSRPPLRVVNAEPSMLEDEFCDIEVDSDGSSPVSVHVEDASPRSGSPSEVVGDGSFWSELMPFIPGSPDPQVDSSIATKPEPTVSRISLEIKLRERHVTFWDVEDGDDLKVTARLELKDLLQETYDHRAEISVRSFVGAPIRGIEHEDEPQFTLHYREQPSGSSGPFKSKKKTINLNAVDPNDGGTADLPSWAKAALQEKDKKAQISAFDWMESSCGPVPAWLKHFGIPIPAELFDYRESRIFQIEAKVSFRSKFSGGQLQSLEAPPIQVSVTHLHSCRELGIRTHVPARIDPYKTR